jgi:hypothetical protein
MVPQFFQFKISLIKKKQDWQCKYNVTLRRVRLTIVAVENQYYIFCLSYPASKAHSPYYIVICGLSGWALYSILSHKRKNFRKKNY